jgi:hypothetical protein
MFVAVKNNEKWNLFKKILNGNIQLIQLDEMNETFS